MRSLALHPVSPSGGTTTMNFFDLHGPAFLIMYVAFFMLSIMGAKSAYQHLTTVSGTDEVPKLDPYETAYLNGGSARVLLSATASLAERGIIEINEKTKSIELKADPDLRNLPPIERELIAACGPANTVTAVFKQMEP
ncbi:MAG: TIGR04222 domain-containing membrane protein, partial [Terriglobales bacterium]